jgi:hypothetical protein
MDWLFWLARLLPGGKTYVASRHSKERLYHRAGCSCQYMDSILPSNTVYFKTNAKAEGKGLRLCGLCREQTGQKTLQDY